MKTLLSLEEAHRMTNGDFAMIVAKTHNCATCKVINDHLERTIKGFDSINVAQIYVDDIDAFRGEHVVFSVPTVLIFSQGKELLRQSRFIDTAKVNRLIEAYKK